MRMSARRTILIALMAGGALIGAAAPALADAEAAAVPLRTMQPDGSGDDDGRAPAGGVETGQGGTANDFEFLLPLTLFGDGAAAAAGAVLIRRRRARRNGSAFLTDAVYGDAPGSQLRLITCGGDFDDTNRRYLDNIIVYARGPVELMAVTFMNDASLSWAFRVRLHLACWSI